MAPIDQLYIVRFDPTGGQRSLDLARWGLVTFWANDIAGERTRHAIYCLSRTVGGRMLVAARTGSRGCRHDDDIWLGSGASSDLLVTRP